MSVPPSSFGGGEAIPFAISAPPSLELTGNTGQTSVTVTNLTGRVVRARILPRGTNGADDAWFMVVGYPEIPMGVGATATVNIAISVPLGTPPGPRLMRVDVVAEDDTETVTGQSVSFTVGASAAPSAGGKFPWLIVIIVAILVLALIGGAAWYFVFRTPTAGSANPSVSPTGQSSAPRGPTTVTNNRPPQIAGDTVAGGVLSLMDKGSWSVGELSFSFQWQRCDGNNCLDIPGAGTDSYTTTWDDAGHGIQLHVTVLAGDGSTGTADSNRLDITWPPDACIDGYVWRLAKADDHVCVTQEIADQVIDDNAQRESRWVVGNYGPHTCIPGYVWREAFEGDDVCVLPERRTQAKQDNIDSPSRVRS
jgi:hypothetical protein